MKRFFLLMMTTLTMLNIQAQQSFYIVNSGNGNGIKFWGNTDHYKIHMGNTTEYKYGPVTDYSIKMNMTSTSGRGWTWGLNGLTPIAALSNTGKMQIASDFTTFGSILFEGNNNRRIRGISSSGHHTVAINGNWDELLIKGRVIDWTGSNLYIGYANNHSGDYIEIGRKVGYLKFLSGGGDSEAMRIAQNGSVGIGTTTPSEKLSVNGTISSKEVKVEAAPWPDYVFSSEYNLKSLEETEAYIKENKHLPDMPSAEEVAENGVALGEMNRLLVQKVEELTLYLIEKDRQMEKQNKLIEELYSKVLKLEAEIK